MRAKVNTAERSALLKWRRSKTIQITGIMRYIIRPLLAVAMIVVLAASSPVPVQAATNPVDLELGGEGATPWVISHIKPGDSGIKTVALRNTGSKDGFVTIWVSDIVSSEGLNPESETGDTTEPGEADDYLQLNLSADGLNTNLDLPATVIDLPQSATASNCIEIIPLKAGGTANLAWNWELPAQTGNDAQGDNISFTINYLLQECTITDVSGIVDANGVFTQGVTAKSTGDKGKLTVNQGTVGKTREDQPLSEVWIIELDKEKPPPPENKSAIGFCYDAGPEGATFDQPITITFSYLQSDILPGVNELDLVIALWDKNLAQWVELLNCTVDTLNNTISAPISHFSRYTIIAPVPAPLPPPPVAEEEEELPTPAPGEETAPPKLLEVDMLGKTDKVEISADGILSEPLTLTDRSSDFIIDIKSGSRISGSGGTELSRIELRIADESIVVPDDIVILSPIYELRGYTRNMQITGINFTPPATLTIRYDPKNLPENTFPPFIANYTDEQGLVQLPLPPDGTIEIGKAMALISHASLFAVAAEVLPPPPPLPARFEASNLIINPQQAQFGEPITIIFTITNEGETTGSTELYLIIDGIVRVVKDITLSAKSSETLTFEVSNLSAGKHQVKIAGLSEQFSVVKAATLTEESRVNWLVIDLSVGTAFIMGALVLYFIIKRSRRISFLKVSSETTKQKSS